MVFKRLHTHALFYLVLTGLVPFGIATAFPSLSYSQEPTSAQAAAVSESAQTALGQYSGSFDPPTSAHESLIRYALEHFHLQKMVIYVNADGGKNFKSSVDERVQMLKAALSDIADRVEIQPIHQAIKEKTFDQRASDASGPVFQIIGEDSFQSLPVKPESSNEKRHWVVFRRPGEAQAQALPEALIKSGQLESVELPSIQGISSSAVRDAFKNGVVPKDALNPAVLDFIQKHKLYPNFPSDLAQVQKSIHEQAFASFVHDMSVAMPELDLKSLGAPPFDSMQSPAGRVDEFERWVIENKGLQGETREKFLAAADSLLMIQSGGGRFAKIPTLLPPRDISQVASKTDPKIISNHSVRLPKRPDQEGLHSLDLKTYGDQRILPGIQDLLNEKRVPVYIHDGSKADALAFHQKQGFDQVIDLLIGRGNVEKQAALIRNSKTGERAYVWPNVVSEDEYARAKEQLSIVMKPHKVQRISHRIKAPLFEWNDQGQALKLGPQDEVIIGFQNRIDAKLAHSSEWRVEPLASHGLRINLYTHIKSGRRIVSPRNVYGDEMKELIHRLYDKGARRMLLLGTTGSIDPSIAIGDIVVPGEFMEPGGKKIPISNEMNEIIPLLASKDNVHSATRHGWVQTILRENKPRIEELQEAGVQTIDIEGRYLIEFLKDHPETRGGLALIISDQPFGKINYVSNNATLPKVDAALDRILNPLFDHEWSRSLPGACIEESLKARLEH